MATTKKPPAKKTKTTDAAALVRPSAALRKEWQAIERRIVALRGRGAEAFDELYEAVHEVMAADPPLYLAGGMRSAREFIAKALPGESERSVSRNVLVAVAFSPEDEAAKGIAFLEELAKYAQELSGSSALPRAIDLDRLRIPVKSDGSAAATKRASACDIDEIRAARAALGKKKSAPRPPAETAIARALSTRKSLAGVKVRVTGDSVTFSGVPLAALDTFANSVGRAKIPTR
jgi:hypothetical protein